MKVVITSKGPTLSAQIDPRLGRAQYFIVADTNSGEFNVLTNENVDAPSGAGVGAAKTIIDSGAEAVIAGNCGPKAEQILTSAGVKIYSGITGTVNNAIELLKQGKL